MDSIYEEKFSSTENKKTRKILELSQVDSLQQSDNQ